MRRFGLFWWGFVAWGVGGVVVGLVFVHRLHLVRRTVRASEWMCRVRCSVSRGPRRWEAERGVDTPLPLLKQRENVTYATNFLSELQRC